MGRGTNIFVALFAGMAIALAGFAGCTQQQAGSSPMNHAANSDFQTLYARLGGEATIRKVVDNFAVRIRADDRISKRFAKTDMPRFKEELVLQLCELSGGPQVYTGKDMKTAHKGMNITDAEFNAFMGDLQKSLDEVGVPAEEKEELMVKLTPMKSDIVGQ